MKVLKNILPLLLACMLVSCASSVRIHRLEKRLGSELQSLDKNVFALLNPASKEDLINSVPQEMVLYKYVNDSLVFWINEFPTTFDDSHLQKGIGFQLSQQPTIESISYDYCHVRFASKDYIAYRSDFEEGVTVIAALALPESCSHGICSLSDTTGHEVCLPSRQVQGRAVPVFRYEDNSLPGANSIIVRQLVTPYYYAGRVFETPAIFLIVNLLVVILAFCLINFNEKNKYTTKGRILAGALFVIEAAYVFLTVHSLFRNSAGMFSHLNITVGLLLGSYILLGYNLFQELSQIFVVGRKTLISIFSAILAFYGALHVILENVHKEKARTEVWSQLLSQDRDIRFEVLLKNLEKDLLSDAALKEYMTSQKADMVRLAPLYLKQKYLQYVPTDYDISLFVSDNGGAEDAQIYRFLSAGEKDYIPISQYHGVFFIPDSAGYIKYSIFLSFYNENAKRYNYVLLNFVQNPVSDNQGFQNLLADAEPSNVVTIPAHYSYAKYSNGRLVDYSGYYAYPVVIDTEWERALRDDNTFVKGNYVHHKSSPSDDVVIIISRPKTTLLTYLLVYIHLFLIFLVSFRALSHKKRKDSFGGGHFKARIYTLVIVSLVLVLVSMTVVSVVFVYNRNKAMQTKIMSDKILTAQTLFESVISAETLEDIVGDTSFAEYFATIAKNTKSDFSLYSPDGRVFMSTQPVVYARGVLPSRINSKAYYNIVEKHQRFYISQEVIGFRKVYFLYAPIMNHKGDIVAILSSPYFSSSSLVRDAFSHAAMVVGMFFLLLSCAILLSGRILDSLFKPLIRMGTEMTNASYKEIVYDKDDEVGNIVKAYNNMVREILQSQKILAQSERDKAWSEMARQVAHEIKNPLTPIKLEIQRMIRLKERGVEDWDGKFAASCAVILEHIDILADTANEFSTFAKLYTQENTLFDVDMTLSEQISLFSSRENVKVSYLGTRNCEIMAPKPQIIRVFVNLISNAVQAVEGVENGMVLVSLRNSDEKGWIDIVFEDNGMGVSKENREKLFTPNFTTKSSGTGLGLAICRNIVEKCGGTIRYSQSFNLHGACFTIKLPKNI